MVSGQGVGDLGDLEKAAQIFSRLTESYRTIHPAEAALTTCELVRIHLKQGFSEKAQHNGNSMRALLEPLRANRIVSAAIVGHPFGAKKSDLHPRKSVLDRIEGERQKSRDWEALRIQTNEH